MASLTNIAQNNTAGEAPLPFVEFSIGVTTPQDVRYENVRPEVKGRVYLDPGTDMAGVVLAASELVTLLKSEVFKSEIDDIRLTYRGDGMEAATQDTAAAAPKDGPKKSLGSNIEDIYPRKDEAWPSTHKYPNAYFTFRAHYLHVGELPSGAKSIALGSTDKTFSPAGTRWPGMVDTFRNWNEWVANLQDVLRIEGLAMAEPGVYSLAEHGFKDGILMNVSRSYNEKHEKSFDNPLWRQDGTRPVYTTDEGAATAVTPTLG